MKSIKLKITPSSAFGSQIQSDTLWGQFCWTIAEQEGAKTLEEYLSDVEKNPFVVFSDAFFDNTLPRPILAPAPMKDFKDEKYSRLKKVKKKGAVSLKTLVSLRKEISSSKITKELLKNENPSDDKSLEAKSRERDRTRNSINRLTGAAMDGSLFTTKETWYKEGVALSVYAKLDESKMTLEQFKKVFDIIAETGYGRDRAVGLGQFSYEVEEDPSELSSFEGANAFVSLSNGFNGENCTPYRGKTITKFGKHGGGLATGANPFKNPIVLFAPGSSFEFEQKKEVYGTAFNSLSANEGTHWHSAWMIPFFIRIKKDE